MRGISVFGSNYGAVYRQGIGLQGNSYAIPTRDAQFRALPLSLIRGYIDEFLSFVETNQDLEFVVTPIGVCWGAYDVEDIAPLCTRGRGLPNIVWPIIFHAYWATHEPIKTLEALINKEG